MTIVRIDNSYADREHATLVTVDDPTPDQSLEDWWEDVVFPHTGDGKGGHCYTEARVTVSDRADIVGQTRSWEG